MVVAVEEKTKRKPKLSLRQLADLYESMIEVGVRFSNQSRAVEQGVDEAPNPVDMVMDREIEGMEPIGVEEIDKRMEELLETIREQMEVQAVDHPAIEFLLGIPGVNRTVACRICGLIPMDHEHAYTKERANGETVTRPNGDFGNFSELRTFAGITPGKNKHVKGQKSCFSSRLRVTLYVAFGSILKARASVEGKPYAPKRSYVEIYNKWRVEYARRHGVCTSSGAWLYNHGYWMPHQKDQAHWFYVNGSGWEWQQRRKCSECGDTEWVTAGKSWECAELEHKNEGSERLFPESPDQVGSKVGQFRFKVLNEKKPTELEWPDKRQHLAAKNKLLDVFLVHLWRRWREKLGWSVRSLYVHEKLGHQMDYDAADFSSGELAVRKMKEWKKSDE